MSDADRTAPPCASPPMDVALDLFVSYTRVDRPFVAKLVAMLEAAGYSVWWDFAIKPGENFNPVIRRALEAAKCVVVVWSKTSVNSDWVHDEASVGRRKRILVPLRIQSVEVPLGFGQVHDVDFTHWKGSADEQPARELLAGIATVVGRAPSPVPDEPRPWPLRWLAIGLAAIALAVAAALYSLWGPSPDFVRYEGFGVFDATGEIHGDIGLEECEARCRQAPRCKAYSYATATQSCALAPSYQDMRRHDGFRAGVRGALPQPTIGWSR